MTQRPFVNVNDIELTPQTPQKPEAGFEARVAPIAARYALGVVPPGVLAAGTGSLAPVPPIVAG
jgi:hypothetical protein